MWFNIIDIKAEELSIADSETLSVDAVSAVLYGGTLRVKNEKLLPLLLKRVQNADMWLETCAIDSHRANPRLLKNALSLSEKSNIGSVLR